MHDRKVLELGPTGAPRPDVRLRPRGRRIVVEHVDDAVYPMVPIAAP